MNPTRTRLVRDAFAALWLSVLAGIAAALTLALIVVAFASIAPAQARHDELEMKPGEGEARQIVPEDRSPRTLSPPQSTSVQNRPDDGAGLRLAFENGGPEPAG